MTDVLAAASLKRLLILALPYGVLVTALRLFGYWGAFGINPLEHIAATDILKLGAFPLLASLLLFLTGAALSELVLGGRLPPGGGAETRVGRLGISYGRILVTVLIIIMILGAYFGREPNKWLAAAMLFSLLSVPLSHTKLAIAAFPNPRLRRGALSILLFIPGLAFADGRTDAYLAKVGLAPLLVDVSRSKMSLASTETAPAVYLGRLGDRFVIYETASKRLVLTSTSEAKALVLMRNPRES